MSEKTIDRRGFLTHGLAGFSLAATAPHFLSLSSRVFADAGGGLDARVLVVLQLSGGNDGLSTVVPYADDAYYRARRQTAIAQKDVLKLNDYVGFHPTLKKAEALFKDGRLAIVQGASYPNPNRSHFKSMDVWHNVLPPASVQSCALSGDRFFGCGFAAPGALWLINKNEIRYCYAIYDARAVAVQIVDWQWQLD